MILFNSFLCYKFSKTENMYSAGFGDNGTSLTYTSTIETEFKNIQETLQKLF